SCCAPTRCLSEAARVHDAARWGGSVAASGVTSADDILSRNRSVELVLPLRTAYQGATLMKTLVFAACALLLLSSGTSAQTLDDLKKDGNGGSTDNILTYGMGYHQQRYSPLKQINKQTVKRLVLVWNLSLDNNWGEQAQPIVYNGMMYVTNAKATVAI